MIEVTTYKDRAVMVLGLGRSGLAAAAALREGGAAIQRFQEAAARTDGPLERWATQIASGSSGITSDSTRTGLNARWQSTILPFCEQALADRYPFNRRAQADVAVADFQKLFGPAGLIDGQASPCIEQCGLPGNGMVLIYQVIKLSQTQPAPVHRLRPCQACNRQKR